MRSKQSAQVITSEKSNRSQRTIRIGQITFEKLSSVISKANLEEGSKRIKSDAVLDLAIGLLNDSHIVQLRERSLSNADRLDRAYRDYVVAKGAISKDAFLGLMMEGKLNGLRPSARS